jgi:hypothetical protein
MINGEYCMSYSETADGCSVCERCGKTTASGMLIFQSDRVVSCLLWYNDVPVTHVNDIRFEEVLQLLLLNDEQERQIIRLYDQSTHDEDMPSDDTLIKS